MFGGKGKKLCPFFRSPCKTHDCEMYIQILGKHPQTGKDMQEWGCSFALTPILLIENVQQTRQAGAATESMRNEIIKRMDASPARLIAEGEEYPPLAPRLSHS